VKDVIERMLKHIAANTGRDLIVHIPTEVCGIIRSCRLPAQLRNVRLDANSEPVYSDVQRAFAKVYVANCAYRKDATQENKDLFTSLVMAYSRNCFQTALWRLQDAVNSRDSRNTSSFYLVGVPMANLDGTSQLRSWEVARGIWWETSGLPFCLSYYREDGVWKGESSYQTALNSLGIIANITMFTSAKPLVATNTGKVWFDASLVKTLETQTGLPTWRMPSRLAGDLPDSGHVTLIRAGDFDYIGGYRLGGWGWFFRITQSNANPETAIPVVVAATKYLYNHRPEPVGGKDRMKFVWHVDVKPK